MSDKYKKLYDKQKAEHEQTWAKLRLANRDARLARMSYDGAIADSDETVAVMRKHLLAMIQFLDLNFPRNGEPSKGSENA